MTLHSLPILEREDALDSYIEAYIATTFDCAASRAHAREEADDCIKAAETMYKALAACHAAQHADALTNNVTALWHTLVEFCDLVDDRDTTEGHYAGLYRRAMYAEHHFHTGENVQAMVDAHHAANRAKYAVTPSDLGRSFEWGASA